MPVVVQEKWAAAVAGSAKIFPALRKSSCPKGAHLQVGERFAFPGAARALTRIAVTQGTALYGGEIAAAAAAHAAKHGGAMRVADFEAFSPEWVEPIGMEVYGHRLHQIPPNGQGIAALIALGILQNVDVAAHAVDSAAGLHLQIEAMKLGFADTYAHVADPIAHAPHGRGDARSSVSQEGAPHSSIPNARKCSARGMADQGGTIYLTAADERGMMVSFIQSNYMGFGSGVVVPRVGTVAAKSRPRLLARSRQSQLRRAGQAPLSHHHSRLPHQGWTAANELRCDGRQYAAPGTSADLGAHAAVPAVAASGLRCAALAFQ